MVFIFFFGWFLFDIFVIWNNVIGGLVVIVGILYYFYIVSLEKENAA